MTPLSHLIPFPKSGCLGLIKNEFLSARSTHSLSRLIPLDSCLGLRKLPTLSDLPCCPALTTASKHADLWTGSLSNSCFHGADWKDRLIYGVRRIEEELCVFETQNKIFHYRSRHWHNFVVRTTPLLEFRFIFASVLAVFAQFGHSFVQVLQRQRPDCSDQSCSSLKQTNKQTNKQHFIELISRLDIVTMLSFDFFGETKI